MVHLLYKYLIIHKQVVLPQLGVFFIAYKPAQHDLVSNVFHPPISDVKFVPEAGETDERLLYFIASEKGIDKAEAASLLRQLADEIQKGLNAHRAVELPEMGLLRKSSSGALYFEPANVLTNYFPPAIVTALAQPKEEMLNQDNLVPLKKEEHVNGKHKIPVKDPWWIYAIILGFIGVAAIFYYYYQNKGLR
jgi:hypothetical protein